MDWLKSIAPTIATALGGPLAGLAVNAVSSALGIDPSKVEETIASGKLSADQIASIQQAELGLKARAQELGLDFAKLAVDDRKSARELQATIYAAILILVLEFVGLMYYVHNEYQKSKYHLEK